MNIRSIKTRAEDLVINCKAELIRIFILMMVVGLIPELFSGEDTLMGLLSLIASIVFIAFQHGYIVSTLKVVKNNAQALKDDDAFVGFSRFKELAPTYLIMTLVYFVISLILIIIFIIAFAIMFAGSMGALIEALSSSTELSYEAANTLLVFGPVMIVAILFFIAIAVTVVYIANLYLFATPYLLEEYNIKNLGALKESSRFMKGFKIDLFKLDISYIGWLILEMIIFFVVSNILSGLPILGAVIASAVGGLFAVYTYIPQYQVSRAIFFEEIAYQRYQQSTQSQETVIEQDKVVSDNTEVVSDHKEGE